MIPTTEDVRRRFKSILFCQLTMCGVESVKLSHKIGDPTLEPGQLAIHADIADWSTTCDFVCRYEDHCDPEHWHETLASHAKEAVGKVAFLVFAKRSELVN